MRAIIGLGNPGERYESTRHNIGFMVLDALAHEAGKTMRSRGFKSLTCRLDIAGQEVILAKPLTYMNLSGLAVREILIGCRLQVEDLVVVLDDLNLPFGALRIRERGSSGGQKGLQSILDALGTDEIVRMRIGIGEESILADKADFVLSDFPPERAKELHELISRAGNAVRMIVTDGVAKAMSIFNA